MDKKKNSHQKSENWLWFLLIIPILIFFIYRPILGLFPISEVELGTFGDSFGGLNALFSGLAFGGVIITLILQRKELKLQREELEATREELKGQKEQMKKQNETLALQQFENTFFNLLKNLEEKKKLIFIHGQTGETAIENIYGQMKNVIHDESTEEEAKYFWKKTSRYSGKFDSHINRIQSIISLIHDSEIKNKNLYFSLLISNLSNYEYILILFAGLSGKFHDLKSLIEEIELFSYFPENLRVDVEKEWLIARGEPINLEKYYKLYEKKAFGEN